MTDVVDLRECPICGSTRVKAGHGRSGIGKKSQMYRCNNPDCLMFDRVSMKVKK